MSTEQLQANFYTIGVKFRSNDFDINAYHGKLYTYKVPKDMGTFEIGDYVVVRVEGKEPELKIVKVFEVNEGNTCDQNATFKYKWVIQKIDLSGYETRLENDRKLEALIAELKNRKLRQSVIDEISSVASPDELALVKQLSGLLF